ncbi:MAG: hypothetical protein KDL87_04535 [Verrucomicrobiae bacterium]|nr:hypothetical protein [Verrucomicrobiae bacterium]
MTKMPWSFKAVLGSYGIVAIGAGLMVAARMVGRWESIALLAYGLIIAAAGLAGVLLFAGIGAATKTAGPAWRRRCAISVLVAIGLGVGLFFLGKTA